MGITHTDDDLAAQEANRLADELAQLKADYAVVTAVAKQREKERDELKAKLAAVEKVVAELHEECPGDWYDDVHVCWTRRASSNVSQHRPPPQRRPQGGNVKGNVWEVKRIDREAGFQPCFDVTIRFAPENASEYPTFAVDESVIVIKESALARVLEKEFKEN